MSLCRWLAITFSAVVLALSIFLYSPAPYGVDEPQKVQAHIALKRIGNLVAFFVHTVTGVSSLSVERAQMEMLYTPVITPSDELQVETVHIVGIQAKIYRPVNSDRPDTGASLQPCVVYFHGGGWTLFSTNSYDVVTRALSKNTAATVISVEYRLAPEYPYPIPFDDCLKVTRHILHHGDQYQVDSHRVTVAGDGTGGNLAAAVALRLGEEDPEFTPRLRLQILIQPVLQALTFNTPSYRDNAYYSLIDRSQMIKYWCNYMGIEPTSTVLSSMERGRHVSPTVRRMLFIMYLVDVETIGMVSIDENSEGKAPPSHTPPDLQSPDYDPEVAQAGTGVEVRIQDMYFAPIMSDDVSKTPPAVILTGDQDVVRDDGLVYARKLTEAGVNVTLRRMPGVGQGHLAPLMPLSYLATWLTFSGSPLAWEFVYSVVRENV